MDDWTGRENEERATTKVRRACEVSCRTQIVMEVEEKCMAGMDIKENTKRTKERENWNRQNG